MERDDKFGCYALLYCSNDSTIVMLFFMYQMLILDEADQCLSMGFADTMNCILEELPTDRQTLLFSATQTR